MGHYLFSSVQIFDMVLMAPKVEVKSKDQVPVGHKRRKKERDTLLFLPKEMIFNILLVIPARVLQETMRYVCKQWYDIVSDPHFIRAHCQLSSTGHLIQDPTELHQVYYIEEDATELKVTQVQIPYSAKLYGSLNGLILLQDFTNPENLVVMNPLTKLKLSLPPVAGLDDFFGIGFAITSSGHYKVVHVPKDGCSVNAQMMLFTIGVDKAWRFIDLQDIPLNSKAHGTLKNTPLLIGGLLYWFSSNYICFALDVNTETIYRFSRPENLVIEFNPVFFISLGASLGLMKGEQDNWRLWELRDVKSNEWTELGRINVRGVLSKVDKMFYGSSFRAFIPIKVIDGEFWFYRRVNEEFVVVRYNLTRESFVFFPIKRVYIRTILHPHAHTLLSPKQCYPGII